MDSYPKDAAVSEYSYGTAGFRMKQSVLDRAVAMSGLVAALRSITTGKATGGKKVVAAVGRIGAPLLSDQTEPPYIGA